MALLIVVQNLLFMGFSADSKLVQSVDLAFQSLDLACLTVGVQPPVIFAVAVAVIAGLNGTLYRTRLGCNLRAASEPVSVSEPMRFMLAQPFWDGRSYPRSLWLPPFRPSFRCRSFR